MSNLILHPEYGVNPTMPICFWCGESDGTIALLGRGYKGEAPHSMVLNYDPCDKCKEQWSLGITFLEVKTSPLKPDQPPLEAEGRYVYPTGSVCVVKESAFRDWPIQEMVKESILKKRRAYIDPATWDKIGMPREDVDNRVKG